MAVSTKQALVHYLEFLKESGYLYAEGLEPAALAGLTAPAVTRPRPENPASQSRPAAAPAAGESAPSGHTAHGPSPAERETRETVPMASSAAPRETAPAPATSPGPVSPPPVLTPVTPEPELFTGPPLTLEERLARLAEGKARAEACRACPLGEQRHKLVYYDGDPMAKLVFVGEAPGGEEDRQGLPFVGAAGQLLNKMLAAIGFKREEIYICNTLKCRPPHNRDPLPAEKAACEPFLLEQLSLVRPQILVALGAHAAQYLCHSEEGIGRLRGRWRDYHGIPLLATYHPAFLLHTEGKDPARAKMFKQKCWADFQMIHALYTRLNPDEGRQLWSRKENSS